MAGWARPAGVGPWQAVLPWTSRGWVRCRGRAGAGLVPLAGRIAVHAPSAGSCWSPPLHLPFLSFRCPSTRAPPPAPPPRKDPCHAFSHAAVWRLGWPECDGRPAVTATRHPWAPCGSRCHPSHAAGRFDAGPALAGWQDAKEEAETENHLIVLPVGARPQRLRLLIQRQRACAGQTCVQSQPLQIPPSVPTCALQITPCQPSVTHPVACHPSLPPCPPPATPPCRPASTPSSVGFGCRAPLRPAHFPCAPPPSNLEPMPHWKTPIHSSASLELACALLKLRASPLLTANIGHYRPTRDLTPRFGLTHPPHPTPLPLWSPSSCSPPSLARPDTHRALRAPRSPPPPRTPPRRGHPRCATAGLRTQAHSGELGAHPIGLSCVMLPPHKCSRGSGAPSERGGQHLGPLVPSTPPCLHPPHPLERQASLLTTTSFTPHRPLPPPTHKQGRPPYPVASKHGAVY